MTHARQNQIIAAVLFVMSFAILAATAGHYGITYDEPIYLGTGQRHVQWFSDLWQSIRRADVATPFSRQALDAAWYAGKDNQPPLVKVISGAGQRWLGGLLGAWAAMRLPSVLLFSLAVAGLFLLCAPVWGRIAAGFAALSLLLMPQVFAHAHLAALDAPIASLSLLTIIAFARLVQHETWQWMVVTGVLFGLALLTKLNAFFLPIMVIPWAAVYARRMVLPGLIALGVIGPAVFFIGWPWLWPEPFTRLVGYLSFHMRHYPVDVYYLGKTYHYAPWHYPWVLTAVTTPPLTLLFALAGIAGIARRQPERRRLAVLLAIGAAVSLLFSSLPFAPKYNGVRLFLPAFPFIAGLAGAGCGLAMDGLRAASARWHIVSPSRSMAAALALMLLLPSLLAVTATHPYQLAYYNRLIGGPMGARERGFETIYWGGIYVSALGELNRLPEGATIYITPAGAISLLEFYQHAAMLRSDLRFVSAGGSTWLETLHAIGQSDLVMFQCAQSEFDPVSWPLYRSARPAISLMLGPGNLAVPLLNAYPAAQALRLLESQDFPQGAVEPGT